MVNVINIPGSIVGDFVGHNQLSTTMNIYTHVTDSARQQISISLNNLFLKIKAR